MRLSPVRVMKGTKPDGFRIPALQRPCQCGVSPRSRGKRAESRAVLNAGMRRAAAPARHSCTETEQPGDEMALISAQTRRTAGRTLREARRQLMNRGVVPTDLLQPQLARSWARSWQAGLQPCGRLPGAPHASGPQLARAVEAQRELVAHAQPVMQFLAEQTQGSDTLVMLAGADGMLLQALGDLQFASRAERVALRPGAVWCEQYRGTNAIGTALAEAEAVVVHAGEHYLERNGFLTCAAAPIVGPTGKLLGVLDVSGDQRGFHRHTLALVRAAARMIEH